MKDLKADVIRLTKYVDGLKQRLTTSGLTEAKIDYLKREVRKHEAKIAFLSTK